jgi:DNA-binding transcriptional LysR family regulator
MLEQLRHFLLIAEHGTFTAASVRAHLSQPALTASIRRLEGDLDAKLFDRGRTGARLTQAGEALLPHARAAVVAVDEGSIAVRALESLEAGEVRLGGGSTACTYLLPPVLSAFRKKYPKIALRLRELPEEQALDAFDRGELDFAIVSSKRGDLFRREELVLVSAPNVDPSSMRFITSPPGGATRAALDRHFPGADILMEISSISAIKGSVRAGLGITLITRSAVTTDLGLGRLVLIPDQRTPIQRPLRLLHRGLDRLSAAARRLRLMLLDGAPRQAGKATKTLRANDR